jgi:NAD(P)-dependent dehydrogenase (short-subunit alcohol dehydrogenase family)
MEQVFFLTGSSRGLGRQVAEAALAAGHRLVAAARERAEADAARHDLTVSTDRDDATAADRDPLGAASSA